MKRIFQSVELRKAYGELEIVNALEKKVSKLTDVELQVKTPYFRNLLEKGKSLAQIRPEVFAVIREVIKRRLDKRLFDVQIVGAILLDFGSIAEMKTGEGKTLTSIPTVYLNALTKKSVIVVTVNEYLAKRDAEETMNIHNFMGLTVGINMKDMSPMEKRQAYHSDITYSVHSEVGFDYLKDNMVKKIEHKVQRKLFFVIIDEADSILIDEAKTPLIISGGKKGDGSEYLRIDVFVKTLKTKDYEIDAESNAINLTTSGIDRAHSFFRITNIFDIQNSEVVHMIQNALRSNYIFEKDNEYIIKEGEIVLVDAFTGRTMEGRSYSDGLHQAIQAKEKVEITPENHTLATITYQNLFRMFKKLSGMTGTAKTEEDEFIETYNTRVFAVPTNKPNIRIDHDDEVFVTYKAKMQTICGEIKKANEKGQPILVGTAEINESEYLSKLLKNEGLKHTVLNAKQNEKEAEIIASAGEFKSITIATNMAGRGTDIKPSSKTLEVGGLYVIGTTRAEARRIDNQLRGRSGRQGDVGKTKFFISLEDKLIQRFSNSEKLRKSFPKDYSKPINSKTLAKSILRAQLKIEGFNHDMRKNVLQYDDVIRQQRDVIYAQRDIIISHSDLLNIIHRMMKSVIKDVINFPDFLRDDKSINMEKLVVSLNKIWFALTTFKLSLKDIAQLPISDLVDTILKDIVEVYEVHREVLKENLTEVGMHQIERNILLTIYDKNWEQHIDKMSKLRSSTALASYAQKNPYQVYVEEGTKHFNDLLQRISHNTIRTLMQNRHVVKRVTKSEAILKKEISRVKGNSSNLMQAASINLPKTIIKHDKDSK